MSFPKFPEFQKLTINDRDMYLYYYAQLDEPYSDFSFDNALVWLDFHNDLEVSDLNNNLVLRFTNILENNTTCYSIIGVSHLEATIYTLLGFLVRCRERPVLSYVPEQITLAINHPAIHIQEDIDNKDYIYDVNSLAAIHGKQYRNLRERVIKFENNQNISIRPLNSRDQVTKEMIFSTIQKWSETENFLHNDPNRLELVAIRKHLDLAESLNMHTHGIYLDDKLVCIIITHSPPHKGWLIGNHLKYDYDYPGAFGYAVHVLAQLAQSEGIAWLNIEQDLGIEGLRRIKTLLRPEKFLRRYTVSLDTEAKYQ
jgi:hypothetical protein